MRTPCTIDGCRTGTHGRGLCLKHYSRWRNHGDPNVSLRPPRKTCGVAGCGRIAAAKSLCGTHYSRLRRGGDPTRTTRVKRAPACSVDGCATEVFARGWCNKHYSRWRTTGDPATAVVKVRGVRRVDKGYLYQRHGNRNELAHRVVMERVIGRPLRPDESVHHKNGDRADNRPENLELWSRFQPSGQRVEDKVSWARELLALYQPEPEWVGAGC